MWKGKIKNLIAWILAVIMILTSPIWPGTTEVEASTLPSLTVDMSAVGDRDLYHGATGWLYGQGDDQVPTANTITALKPNTAVQKAPNGMQHPNGDVLDIAETFLNAGGEHIQIYVPDYFALWFYEFTGTEYYMDILEMQAKACIEAGIAEDVVYVLYNEPTADWIGGTYTDHNGNTVTGWDSMNWFWLDMVEKLREIYQDAGIASAPKTAGLNLAVYDESVMENYVKFCAEHDCMPDIVSWHDLSTWQYNIFDQEYNHYRQLEKTYDVEPREIVINEYADRAECASPGDLVRWIGLWEDYEVAGCLPFWHFSNNLNGLVADNNEGNGAWWLYKWYGDMSGSYLPVSVANASQDDFYGVASIDENKKNADIIFGGRDGSAQIVLDQITATSTFANAEKVHVKIESTDYTGFHGAAEEPRVVKEGTVAVVDGTVTIPMSDMNDMSAYHITVTQADEDDTTGLLSGTWKQVYEAEDGTLTGNAVVATADGFYACSNRQKVHIIDNPGDSVTIDVSVPKDGYYKYDMVYCAATGVNTGDPDSNSPYTAIQNLVIDGEETIEMELPSTLNWSMGGMYSTYIYLTRGEHSLKIEATSSQGKAVPDCIYLTYEGKEEEDTRFDKTYEAELGEFNEIKGETTTLTTQQEDGVGCITGLEGRSVTNGGGVRFNVVVPENGMYTLALTYQTDTAATANIYLDNDMVNLDGLRTQLAMTAAADEWQQTSGGVFLQKGINVIDIDTDGAVKLDSMRIYQNETSQPMAEIEAEAGTLTGTGTVGTQASISTYASGNRYVSALVAANDVELIPEGDPEFTVLGLGRQVDLGEKVDANSLTITVSAETAGTYKMLVYQSNGELFGKHDYNAQMTERYASFKVNNQEPQKVVFRNTYSDETFRAQVVDVVLQSGENTITIYNDNSKVVTNGVLKSGETAHRPENIDYGVLTNYTPNFDKFVFYPETGAAEELPDTGETYQVTIKTTKGGSVDADKDTVTAGDQVTLTIQPDDGYTLQDVQINGSSIMSSLTVLGGIYTVGDVSENLEVKAYFEEIETVEIVRDTDYEYAVNAGDIDHTTLSDGDSFGLRNSVTDQFLGADSVTGYQWGIDDVYQYNSSYPLWLTGEKTWPCENDGATDASPKTKSFRYAKNQATTDVGIVYQFELEADATYDLEMGFYVPASWTNSSNPRTMKLVVNDTLDDTYKNFTASNDSNNPYVISTTATADAAGNLKLQIGHADDAVWGPVVSYISIYRQPDTTKLQEAITEYSAYDKEDYTDTSWSAFAAALSDAEDVLENSGSQTNITAINESVYQLQLAAQALVSYVNLDEFKAAYEQYAAYETSPGQGATTDEDWAEFIVALRNVEYLLKQENVTHELLTQAMERLSQAATKLVAPEEIPTVEKITATTSQTAYQVGDSLDTSKLTVTAYYSDGSSSRITNYSVSGFTSAKAGTIKITISYQGCSAELSLTIQAKKVEETPKTQEKLQATKLKVKATAYKTISIKWSKVSGATGYEIYRSTAKKGTYKKVKTITSGSTLTFKNKKLKYNKKYFYKVRAYRKSGSTTEYSQYSNILQVKTKLAAPTIKLKKKSTTKIKVTWKKVTGAQGYQIKYSTKKKSGFKKVSVTKGKTKTYTLSKLKKKKTYYVKVRAYRKVNGKKVYGAWSTLKSVKLK